METRIYPNWDQISEMHNSLTKGELFLLKYLDDNLPKDPLWKKGDNLKSYRGWLIFAQPFLNGSRPDIIIFNPFVGLVIYEVKDWNIDNYKWQDGQLYVSDRNGSYHIKNPIGQVNHYKEKLIGQLIPIIGEEIDKNEKNYSLIKTGLYFHNASTFDVLKKFESKVKSIKHQPIFGRDSLIPNRIAEIVPDVKITKSFYWKSEWNDEVLFWLLPPFHSIEQGTFLRLKGAQIKVAETKTGHYRVRGVAGSGKTQALAYRAGKLASQNLNVLIITFNITLWHYIKDMIARSPFNFHWSKFTFNHFHGFCKDILNEFGQDWPKSPRREDFTSQQDFSEALDYFFRETVPQSVINIINDANLKKYDAILIDEGQDYHYEWYSLLSNYFLTQRDEVLVVCDKRQNIYQRELDWLDKRITRRGLEKFKEPYIDLLHTFRLPKRVAVMSNEFSELFELNQELKVGKFEDLPVLFHSQHIIWLNIKEEDWEYFIYNSFLRLKREGYSASDMVILIPSHKMGKLAVDMFKAKSIEINHVFEDNIESHYHPHKKAFWMGDSRLKMSTIHSFKGWELLNIVLFIPAHAPESNRKLDAIVYTAITRTRENLIVLNANNRYNSFGDKFPKKWNEQ